MQSSSALFDCQRQRLHSFTEVQHHLQTELLSFLYSTRIHSLIAKQVKEEKKRKFMKNNTKTENIHKNKNRRNRSLSYSNINSVVSPVYFHFSFFIYHMSLGLVQANLWSEILLRVVGFLNVVLQMQLCQDPFT